MDLCYLGPVPRSPHPISSMGIRVTIWRTLTFTRLNNMDNSTIFCPPPRLWDLEIRRDTFFPLLSAPPQSCPETRKDEPLQGGGSKGADREGESMDMTGDGHSQYSKNRLSTVLSLPQLSLTRYVQ